jgi:hypothetical protein
MQLAVAAATVAAVGLAVGLTLGLRGGDEKKGPAVRNLTHAEYAHLYKSAVIGTTRIAVLDRWPKPPYQRYHDGKGDLCFEWFDKPVALYNLCFKNDVLADKAIE